MKSIRFQLHSANDKNRSRGNISMIISAGVLLFEILERMNKSTCCCERQSWGFSRVAILLWMEMKNFWFAAWWKPTNIHKHTNIICNKFRETFRRHSSYFIRPFPGAAAAKIHKLIVDFHFGEYIRRSCALFTRRCRFHTRDNRLGICVHTCQQQHIRFVRLKMRSCESSTFERAHNVKCDEN